MKYVKVSKDSNIGTIYSIFECLRMKLWKIVGNALTYIPSSNKEWSDTCVITIKDNENTTKDVTVTFDDIDTVPPICTSWIANPGWWTSWEVTIVTLTWCSEPIFGEISHDFRENTWYTFNFVDEVWNSWSLFVEYTWFDREPPIFKFDSVDWYECLTWTLIISGAVDSGVWLRESPYSFDGINWTNRTLKELYSDIATWVIVSWYVRDWLWNRGIVQAIYTFKDSEPTAEWFTVAALNWIDVDWKALSNAKDWACWSGTLRATVGGWKVWNYLWIKYYWWWVKCCFWYNSKIYGY